ncbi:MAG: hypothetical protein K6B75_02845 [Lachnospiraceae bacterium]|nr:hypothetical protein [Lachnospiraceae bacterium]
MKKLERGEKGYLKYKKTFQLLYTCGAILAGVVIFVVGLLLNKNEVTNVFTILAILMVLPAAKGLTGLVVLFPYKPLANDKLEELEKLKGEEDVVFYDMVFTSTQHVMHLDALYITDSRILGITGREKDNIKVITESLEKALKENKFETKVFITNDEKALLEKRKLRGEADGKTAPSEELVTLLRTFIV